MSRRRVTTPPEAREGAARAAPTIGVTGVIGAGKSAFVDALVRAGAVAFSADAAVHELYDDAEVRNAVTSRWGERILAADGSIDRAGVAAIVFSDDADLAWLEGLLHPLVAAAWLRFVAEAHRREPRPVAIVAEVPLLFESELADRYDLTVCVTAPDEIRRARLIARGDTAIDERAARQLSQDEKAARADVVVDNGGDRGALDAAAQRVLLGLRN
jgi:dephospho-CoA kinase